MIALRDVTQAEPVKNLTEKTWRLCMYQTPVKSECDHWHFVTPDTVSGDTHVASSIFITEGAALHCVTEENCSPSSLFLTARGNL